MQIAHIWILYLIVIVKWIYLSWSLKGGIKVALSRYVFIAILVIEPYLEIDKTCISWRTSQYSLQDEVNWATSNIYTNNDTFDSKTRKNMDGRQ